MLWFNETNVVLLGYVMTSGTVNHQQEAWRWQHHALGCFSSTGTEAFGRVEEILNNLKWQSVLAQDLQAFHEKAKKKKSEWDYSTG